MTIRTCGSCGQEFDAQRFTNGRQRYCSRKCKDQNRVKDGRALAATMKHYYKSRYGMTVEEAAEFCDRPCDICGTTDWPGRHNKPHIDHDHVTGKVRGLLCHNCNLLIGHAKDDPVFVA